MKTISNQNLGKSETNYVSLLKESMLIHYHGISGLNNLGLSLPLDHITPRFTDDQIKQIAAGSFEIGYKGNNITNVVS